MVRSTGLLAAAGFHIVDIIHVVIGNISTNMKTARGKPSSATHVNVRIMFITWIHPACYLDGLHNFYYHNKMILKIND